MFGYYAFLPIHDDDVDKEKIARTQYVHKKRTSYRLYCNDVVSNMNQFKTISYLEEKTKLFFEYVATTLMQS